MSRRFDISHQHRAFTLVLTDDGALELWLDDCLRKRRNASSRDPLYVWTNIELDWEEHHYVEARYFQQADELELTINGVPVILPKPTQAASPASAPPDDPGHP